MRKKFVGIKLYYSKTMIYYHRKWTKIVCPCEIIFLLCCHHKLPLSTKLPQASPLYNVYNLWLRWNLILTTSSTLDWLLYNQQKIKPEKVWIKLILFVILFLGKLSSFLSQKRNKNGNQQKVWLNTNKCFNIKTVKGTRIWRASSQPTKNCIQQQRDDGK